MTFSRFKEILLFAFLTFTVLYYFLRFQWGWDQSIVVLQVILLMAIGGTAVFKAISGRAFHPSFFYIVILYSIALLLPTFIRGGITGTGYGIKNYVLPALLLLGYFYFIPRKNLYKVFCFISFLGFVVSVVYFAEFVGQNILATGYFDYTEGIRKLSKAKGAEYIAESSFSNGIDIFFRLVGPLSHNNSTATVIAIGCLSTVPLLSLRFRKLAILCLFFCIIVLMLTGSRTAAIAVIIGFFYYFRDNLMSIIFVLLSLILIFIATSSFVPAYIEVINITRITNASNAILSEVDRLGMDRFYNLLVGSGYNYPGFKYSWQALSGPLVNDDLFLLQLLTMYGLLPVALFLFCVARMRSIPKNAQDYKFLNAANAILICLIVTVAHTNALIRPQIYPVFFLMIVMKHVIYKKYQAETTLGQKS